MCVNITLLVIVPYTFAGHVTFYTGNLTCPSNLTPWFRFAQRAWLACLSVSLSLVTNSFKVASITHLFVPWELLSLFPLFLENAPQQYKLQNLPLPTCSVCWCVSVGYEWTTDRVTWGRWSMYSGAVCSRREGKRPTGRAPSACAVLRLHLFTTRAHRAFSLLLSDLIIHGQL